MNHVTESVTDSTLAAQLMNMISQLDPVCLSTYNLGVLR